MDIIQRSNAYALQLEAERRIIFVQVQNYTLSEKQISDLQLYSRSVLGEDYYKMVGRFYDSLVNTEVDYRVVLTRKCFNLLYVYHWCNRKKRTDADFSSLFYSDNTLIANIPRIAAYYVMFGRMPDILIVDDILIHGRSIGKLITEFVNKLTDYLKDHGIKTTCEEVEADVLRFMEVRVMVQNDKPPLMKRQFFQRLNLLDGNKSRWSPAKWHELSYRISRLISENIFSNTAYVFSVFEAVGLPIVKNAKKNGFTCTEWDNRCFRQVWVRPLLRRSDNSTVALYTIRLTKNSVDGNLSAVPFIISSDLDLGVAEKIYKILNVRMEEILQKCFGLSKMLPLMLSHELLLHMVEGYDGEIKIDIDKMFSGAGNGSDTRKAFEAIAKRTEPLFTWDQLDDLILEATRNSPPLIIGQHDGCDSLEELVANEGEQIERDVYHVYQKKDPENEEVVSTRLSNKSINELFARLSSQTQEKMDKNISDLLRMMDMGFVAITSQENKNRVQCVYRACEQSQFIHPKRYMVQLPVLCEMERDCMGSRNGISERIHRMYGEDKKLCKELCEFTNRLYDSGQLLEDWYINYSSWAEIDYEKYPELKDHDPKDRIRLQMILNSVNRMREMERYRELYPEN